MNKILIIFIVLLFASTSFATTVCYTNPEECKKLKEALDGGARNLFIEEGKKAGCFDKKVVIDSEGHKISCYGSSSQHDKEKGQWITECEHLCPTEAPACFPDHAYIESERCKSVREYYENPKEWRRKLKEK